MKLSNLNRVISLFMKPLLIQNPIEIATKKEKYIRINKPEIADVKKTAKSTEDLKGKTPMYLDGSLNIIKTSIIPQLICKLNANWYFYCYVAIIAIVLFLYKQTSFIIHVEKQTIAMETLKKKGK